MAAVVEDLDGRAGLAHGPRAAPTFSVERDAARTHRSLDAESPRELLEHRGQPSFPEGHAERVVRVVGPAGEPSRYDSGLPVESGWLAYRRMSSRKLDTLNPFGQADEAPITIEGAQPIDERVG